MITTKLPHIKKEDTVVMYVFSMAVENDQDEIDGVIELAEIVFGANDEIINNYQSFNAKEQSQIVARVNKLLEVYYDRLQKI